MGARSASTTRSGRSHPLCSKGRNGAVGRPWWRSRSLPAHGAFLRPIPTRGCRRGGSTRAGAPRRALGRLRETYRTIADRIRNPPAPSPQNRDGEPWHLGKADSIYSARRLRQRQARESRPSSQVVKTWSRRAPSTPAASWNPSSSPGSRGATGSTRAGTTSPSGPERHPGRAGAGESPPVRCRCPRLLRPPSCAWPIPSSWQLPSSSSARPSECGRSVSRTPR